MRVKTEEVEELTTEDESDTFTVMRRTITGTSRWNVNHELIIQNKETQKYYKLPYYVGATEAQDYDSFDMEGEFITLTEVKTKERIVIDFEEVVPNPLPKETKDIDWTDVINMAKQYVEWLTTDEYHPDKDDYDVYMFEQVMIAVYGKDVFDWVHKQQEDY